MQSFVTYISCFFFNIFLFIFFNKIVDLYNIYDYPDIKRKIHKYRVSLAGGFFIYLSLVFSSIFFLIFYPKYILLIFDNYFNFILFFFSSSFFFFLGYLDDKFNLSAYRKLFISSLIVSILMIFDSSLLITFINFSISNFQIQLGNFSFFFTILCFLLFINAFNMFDGINLQSGIFSIFLFLSIGYFSNLFFFLFCIIVTLIIFLFYNYRSKIFLGNSGALFLSFVISYFLIRIFNFDKKIYSDQIFFLLIHPGFDMLRLFFVRLVNNKNPFLADKNHFHHNLLLRFKYIPTLLINLSLSIMPYIFFILFDSLLVLFVYITIYFVLLFFLKNFKKNFI